MEQKTKGRIQSEAEAFYVGIRNAARARASYDSWTDDYQSCMQFKNVMDNFANMHDI